MTMTRDDLADFARFLTELSRQPGGMRPSLAAGLWFELHGIGRRLRRYAETVCSVELSDAESARVERMQERAEEKAQIIATAHGFRVHTCRDPRGSVLTVHVGGSTIGVV